MNNNYIMSKVLAYCQSNGCLYFTKYTRVSMFLSYLFEKILSASDRQKGGERYEIAFLDYAKNTIFYKELKNFGYIVKVINNNKSLNTFNFCINEHLFNSSYNQVDDFKMSYIAETTYFDILSKYYSFIHMFKYQKRTRHILPYIGFNTSTFNNFVIINEF